MRLLRLCQTCVQQRAMLSGAQCFGYSSRLSCTPSNLNRIQVRNATPHAATTPQSTARPISPLANFAQTNGLQWHTANQRVKLTPKPLLRPSAAGVDLAQPASEPSPQAVETWQTSRAVLLDACCVVNAQRLLQALADSKGPTSELTKILDKLKVGSISEQKALEAGLAGCSAQEVEACLSTQTPGVIKEGAKELAMSLHVRAKAVYLHAPGLSVLAAPLAKALGIPAKHILEEERGSASALEILRRRFPYDSIAVIGSSPAQLEAVKGAEVVVAMQSSGSVADAAQASDWRVRGFSELTANLKQHSVAFIGSGAWATAAAKLAAENMARPDRRSLFQPQLRMWVYEEEFQGRKLSELVNEHHENVKYLPGVKLPASIVACPDLEEVARGATMLIVCTPHQFVYGICKQLRSVINKSAVAISLTKGMRVRPEGPQLISEMVRRTLGIDCCVLMGANIAEEVGNAQLSEGTIGYNVLDNARLFQQLFESEYYLTSLVNDVAGAEMAGSLKNVVALAAGFVDGLGGGANPKATVIRHGLLEIMRLSQKLYPSVQDSTFMESCGVADLVATCYGGRNRRVAEAFVRSLLQGENRSFDELEVTLLKGQKLQGVLTSNEVQQVLELRGWQAEFPLFTVINAIVRGSLHPKDIYTFKQAAQQLLARQ